MYIHIHQDVKCSKCDSLNNYEDVTRPRLNGSDTFRRCLKCGHEQHKTTMTTNGCKPYDIYADSINEPQEF